MKLIYFAFILIISGFAIAELDSFETIVLYDSYDGLVKTKIKLDDEVSYGSVRIYIPDAGFMTSKTIENDDTILFYSDMSDVEEGYLPVKISAYSGDEKISKWVFFELN